MCPGRNAGLESHALAGWSGFHGHCTGIAAVDLYRQGCVSASARAAGRLPSLVRYNVRTVIDTKNHLIVADEIMNEGHRRGQQASMGWPKPPQLVCKGCKLDAMFGNSASVPCRDAARYISCRALI